MFRALIVTVVSLASVAQADPRAEVQARLEKADERIRARDHAGAGAELDAAARLAGDDLELRYGVAMQRATLAAYRGDYERAARELVALVPELRPLTHVPAEFWLHNTIMMIREAQGDVAAALAECDAMTAAGKRGTWSTPAKRELLVSTKELWHRAYLLRMLAERQRGPKRAATLRDAETARQAYAKVAPQPDFRDAVAVLDGYFATLDGRRDAALEAARRVNLVENHDLEDLYLAALALEAGGQAGEARKVREKILAAEGVAIPAAIMRDFIARDAKGGRFTPRWPARRP